MAINKQMNKLELLQGRFLEMMSQHRSQCFHGLKLGKQFNFLDGFFSDFSWPCLRKFQSFIILKRLPFDDIKIMRCEIAKLDSLSDDVIVKF